MRQSMSVDHEAPFLYLLFGADRALLLDTGATADPAAFPLRETVDRLLAEWLVLHPRERYELVVAHSHSHRDHVAGDGQLADRPGTTVIGHEPDQVQEYFGFTAWPEETVRFDLGGRTLELTGIPGHHATALAIYDPWTGFLLTGDSVYPGRLYGFDMPVYAESMARLVAFAEAREITHVMGCHVEMSRHPGRDFPVGARYQPDEAPLPMPPEQLAAVRDAVTAAVDRPGVHVHDRFIVCSGMGPGTIAALTLRGWAQRLRLLR